MIRYAAHFLYVNRAKIIKNAVVERNEQGITSNIFSLNDFRIETSQTIFLSGIIAPLPYSIDYFKLKINELQKQNPTSTVFELLSEMNLPQIEIGKKIGLVLIGNVDWEKKRITEKTVFQEI